MKILLVQLASMGDCLFATAIARQIKEIDYPNCHLTWLIGEQYKPLLENNPYVDEVKTMKYSMDHSARYKIDKFLEPIKENYDKIIITDFTPHNFKTAYGTTRGALFRAYGAEIKNIEPQIFLTQTEVKNVENFAQKHNLNDYYSVLLECGPESHQSELVLENALRIAGKIAEKNPNIKFVFSSKNKLKSSNPNFIDASSLTYRENAELTKYCKLLLGASSGITWLNTSNWAAKIPMLIVVNKGKKYFSGILSPSVEDDFNYWGLSTDDLIEFNDFDENKIVDCVLTIVDKSFAQAKSQYSSGIVRTKEEIDSECIKCEQALVLSKLLEKHSMTKAMKVRRKIYKVAKILAAPFVTNK